MAALPPEIDPSKPHSARIYDYYLGGKNHFAADRQTAESVLAVVPSARTVARENRAFLGRAVRCLAGEAGVRQFLDIGTGLPTQRNVHDVAQEVAPAARVVYVDNDPMVLAHARALLTSSPEGRAVYVDADLRDPASIIWSPAVRAALDFTQPIGLIMLGVLQALLEEDKPPAVMKALLDALPGGSYLAASHVTAEHWPQAAAEEGQRDYRAPGVPLLVRDCDEFAALAFSGLELLPPGVVLVSEWRPSVTGPRPTPAEVSCYGGVARKP